MRHDPIPAARGFTLIEAMIVVAIIGVTTALSYSSYSGMRKRAEARNGIKELVGVLELARSSAFAYGAPTVFFVHRDEAGLMHFGAVVDQDDDFDPADVSTSLEDTDVTLTPLTPVRGVAFRETGAEVLRKPLPAPFASVPASTPCTFCNDDGDVVVRFRSAGKALLGVTPANHPIGGSFALIARDPQDLDETEANVPPIDQRTIAVMTRAGMVTDFER